MNTSFYSMRGSSSQNVKFSQQHNTRFLQKRNQYNNCISIRFKIVNLLFQYDPCIDMIVSSKGISISGKNTVF